MLGYCAFLITTKWHLKSRQEQEINNSESPGKSRAVRKNKVNRLINTYITFGRVIVELYLPLRFTQSLISEYWYS